MRHQQTANWLATVRSSVVQFVHQLPLGPGRLASRVPIGQRFQCFVVREIEAADHTTTNPKGMKIAMRACYRWFY